VDNPALLYRLEEMLAELDHSVEVLRGEHSDRGHPADSGSSLSETDRMQATVEAMFRQRRHLIAAIGRVKDGSYGLCTSCGRPVAPGRLEARPEAARCVNCQAKYDRLHR
jgi:RNA polymerase-binding transcription factor DksA